MHIYLLVDSRDNFEEVSVAIWWVKYCFYVLVKHHYHRNNFWGENHMLVVFAPFSQCIDSNIMEISTCSSFTWRFFVHTPSMIQRIVRICEFVDRFLRKPFWFFRSVFSISCWIRLKSRTLTTLAAKVSKSYIFVVLSDSEVTVRREGKDETFRLFPYRVFFFVYRLS